MNLPVGIIATIMCLTFLPQDKERVRDRKVDYFGIATLIVWVGCFQTFLEEGNQDDWFESPFILTLAVFSVVSFVLWVWRELTAEAPAVDLRVLRHRSLSAGSAYSFVVGIGLYGALFAIPIFAQQVLGYTPYQTGMLLLPGAIASAAMMPVMGRLGGKVDSRILIGIGSLVLIGALTALSHISIQTGPDDMFLPLLFRGAGTVMIFLPLSLATFAPLPRSEVSAASGFYNLTRQLGGSVGVAVLTTVVAKRESFHRSILVEHLGNGDPIVLERIKTLSAGFMGKGADAEAARGQALAVIDRQVGVQASVISFGDTFHIVAILFVVSLLLLAFLGSGRGAKAGGDLH